MTAIIAKTEFTGLDNEVTLTHDRGEYIVKYGISKTYHDSIDAALEDYIKAVELAASDYR